jgi:two-component system, OmpR family, response regulator
MEQKMNSIKRRILAVDDEPKITRWLRLNLEQTGEYEVREENRGSHALDAALEFRPDLILLDVLMPGIDGGELASQFRASLSFRNVPLVFLTAAVTREEVSSHGGYVGGHPFLAKPVDMPELIKCLHSHLEGHASHSVSETCFEPGAPHSHPC